ncbi:hypothetical protein ACHAO7_011929 [Fusarium culmorum]
MLSSKQIEYNRGPGPDADYHSGPNMGSSDDDQTSEEEEDGDEHDDETDEALYQKFKAQGPVLADHSELTKRNLDIEEEQWKRFCQRRHLDDADKAIVRCDTALFKVYLEIRVKDSNVKKLSAVQGYWKRLSMLYAMKAKASMEKSVLFDIRNWLRTYLTPKFKLDTSKKEKSAISVDTLSLLLTHHWIDDERIFQHERLRIQHAAMLIIAGATSTRPGALIGALLYKHLEFQVFLPLEGENRSQLALIVRLEDVKRTAGEKEPKVFAFREDDMLIYDPLVLIQALALADSAFHNNFQRPEDFHNLVVPPTTDRIRLLWKEEWLNRPVFRDVEQVDDDLLISTNKAISYQKERLNLIKLGRSLGIEKSLEWYDLRRGSGKQLNDALTPEERNKIMGHRKGDSSTYLMYYMSNFIDADCQSICFGSAPRHDIVRLAARLRYHKGAPKSLTPEQLSDIDTDQTLRMYLKKRMSAMTNLKDKGYRSMKDAIGTKMRDRYDKYNKKAAARRQKLKAQHLQQAIEQFHKAIHIEEVDRQLEGMKPAAEVIAPSGNTYEIQERAQVAQIFSELACKPDRNSIYNLRVNLIKTLIALAGRREDPVKIAANRGLKASATRKAKSHHDKSQYLSETNLKGPDLTETSMNQGCASGHNCPFCLARGFRSPFSRIDVLARHIRGHLIKKNGPFRCPWPDCTSILADPEHFVAHALRQHGLQLPPQVLRNMISE